MTTTLVAEYAPALTPPPNTAKPPQSPEPSKPARSDLQQALLWMAKGDTADLAAARAADPHSFDAYRTVKGLRAAGILDLATACGMVPGDALAAQYAAAEARRAAAMRVLEARGWNPARAHTALHLRTSGTLADAIRRAVDGEGWTGSGSCSDCHQNHGSGSGYCTCTCHTRWSSVSTALPVTAVQRGQSPDCANGCHAPLCSGHNCTCDCHGGFSATAGRPPQHTGTAAAA